MALKTFTGSFQITTGIPGTVQNVPTIAAAGNKTKFIEFYWNARVDVPTTNGIGNGTHQFGTGVAVNAAVTYPNYCVTTKSQNAVSPSNTSSDVHQSECIFTILAGSNVGEGSAHVTAYNSDGSFDLTTTTVFLSAITIHYKVYYGDDVYMLNTVLTTEPVAPGTVVITFDRRPDFLKVIANPSGPVGGGIADDSRICIGAATFNNNAIQQWVIASGANDNVGTTNCQGYNRGDQFIAHIDSGFAGGLTGKANISAINGRDVTLNWTTTSGGGNREHIVLGVSGGSWHAGNFDTVTAGNNIVVSNLPFRPDGGVSLYSTTKGQTADGVTDTPDERVLGGWDSAGNQRSLTIEDSTGLATSRVSLALQFDSVYASTNGAAGPAIDARITYTSTQNNGFTLAQPTSDGAGRDVYYVAVGDSAPKSLIPFM